MTHDPTQHIFAPDPDEKPEETAYLNHPDHRATGSIVLDAIFPAAGNPRSYRELLVEGLQPYRVHEVYFFMSEQDNVYIDISETVEIKAQGLKCHTTQFDPDWDILERDQRVGRGNRERGKGEEGLGDGVCRGIPAYQVVYTEKSGVTDPSLHCSLASKRYTIHGTAFAC